MTQKIVAQSSVSGNFLFKIDLDQVQNQIFTPIACLVPLKWHFDRKSDETAELTGETVVGDVGDEEGDVLERAVDAVARLADVAARFPGHNSQDRLPAVGRELLHLEAL